MKNKKAEIGTIVMMAVLVIVSIIAFGSSNFSAKKQTINTQAATSCTIGSSNCGSGGNRLCTADNGCNPAICSTQYLEYACCVENYNSCSNGNNKFRWYGCTGQPCGNTIISQGGSGPGYLVACYNRTLNCQGSPPAATSTPPPTVPAGCERYPDQYHCQLDHSGWSYNSTTWACCPPSGGNQGVVNKCLAANNNTNQYKCIDNIQIDVQGNYDANKSCDKAFQGSAYISSLSCNSSIQVCCKKSVTTVPGGPIGSSETGGPVESSGVTGTTGTSGSTGVTGIIAPVPPIAVPTLDVSGKCNDIPCSSPNNGLYWSKKCWNPIYQESTLIGCGGSWSYYNNRGCKDESATGSESSASSSCNLVPRPIRITVKFVINNLDIEPSKPILHFNISNSVNSDLINEGYSLGQGGNFSNEPPPFDINASPIGLRYYIWYNPAGWDWSNSLGGNISVENGVAEVIITLK